MTTTSGKGKARATVGFSNDCNAGDGAGDDSGDPRQRRRVCIPGLPGIPLLDNLNDILGGASASAGTRRRRGASRAPTATAPPDEPADTDVCQLPAALSALVDVNGYVADSQSVSDGSTVTVHVAVRARRRPAARRHRHHVRHHLDGGLPQRRHHGQVRRARRLRHHDHRRPDLRPRSRGLRRAGQPSSIPGLPDDPTAALAALGITVQLPEADVQGRRRQGLGHGRGADRHDRPQDPEAGALPAATRHDPRPGPVPAPGGAAQEPARRDREPVAEDRAPPRLLDLGGRHGPGAHGAEHGARQRPDQRADRRRRRWHDGRGHRRWHRRLGGWHQRAAAGRRLGADVRRRDRAARPTRR